MAWSTWWWWWSILYPEKIFYHLCLFIDVFLSFYDHHKYTWVFSFITSPMFGCFEFLFFPKRRRKLISKNSFWFIIYVFGEKFDDDIDSFFPLVFSEWRFTCDCLVWHVLCFVFLKNFFFLFLKSISIPSYYRSISEFSFFFFRFWKMTKYTDTENAVKHKFRFDINKMKKLWRKFLTWHLRSERVRIK